MYLATVQSQQQQQLGVLTIPTRPTRVFGEPYSSGRPLQFDRSTPWYIVEATTPVEHPVTRWSAVNHRRAAQEQSPASVSPARNEYSSAGIRNENGERVGRSVASAVREGTGSRSEAVQRLTQAALGAHQAFLSGDTGVGHQYGKAYAASSGAGSDESDESVVLPGPGHYDVPSRVAEGPAFSMGGRNVKSPWLPHTGSPDMPGPGQYGQSMSEALPTGPAYTIAGRPVVKEEKREDSAPGPGHYHSERGAEGPAYTIAGTLVPVDGKKGMPGPGDYVMPRTFDEGGREGPAYTLAARAVERERSEEPEPGPGQYLGDVQLQPDGPAFTFALRPAEVKVDPTPGPGDISVLDVWGRTGQAYTFGGKPVEAQPKDDRPGPGDYIVPRQFEGKTDGPAYTIGGLIPESLSASQRAQLPGPGEYDDMAVKMRQMAGPAFSMLGRPVVRQREEDGAPGPAEYTLREIVGRDGVSYTIGVRQEERDHHAGMPGPCEYTLRRDKQEGPAFSIGGKAPEPPEPDRAPGPGDYDIVRQQPEGPSYTILGRVEPPKPSPAPDVGTYNVPPMWQEGPSYTLGERIVMVDKKAAFPGPGEYRVRSDKPDGPAFTIMPPLPEPEPDDRPGPGEYDTKPSGWDGPSYSLGGKLEEQRKDSSNFPGPGMYAVPSQVGREGPMYTIGARLPDAEEDVNLGPGQYGLPIHLEEGPKFTMGQRIEPPAGDAASIPGPGAYGDPQQDQSGPKYSIAPKLRPKEPEPGLGPGHYLGHTNVMTEEGPRITFGVKLLDPVKDTEVGPGQYELPPGPSGPEYTLGALLLARQPEEQPGPGHYGFALGPEERGPRYSMATRLPSPQPQEGPGPGAYVPPAVDDGPKYSILGKFIQNARERDAADEPGPGAYDTTVDKRHDGPKITMGTRLPAVREDSADMPGPAEYMVAVHEEGPKYTIGYKVPEPTTAHALREAADMPAPGDYHGLHGGLPSPGGKITIGERFKEPRPKDIPAPGDYHDLHGPSDKPDGPRFTMGARKMSRREKRRMEKGKGKQAMGDVSFLDEGPGPQDYAPKLPAQGPYFTIKPKILSVAKTGALPAPGDYAPEFPDQGAKFSMGANLVHGSPWAEALRRAREGAPGPGASHYVRDDPRPLGRLVTALMKAKQGERKGAAGAGRPQATAGAAASVAPKDIKARSASSRVGRTNVELKRATTFKFDPDPSS